jgi:poly-beta-1,6-N-acetyl-D-glucosamine synthase
VNEQPSVLMTAARNERAHIAKLMRSVMAQSMPPARWVIVSDASTDGTDECVRAYEADMPYLHLLRMEPHRRATGFAAKMAALDWAYATLQNESWSYLGNLDADLCFPAHYFETLMQHLEEDPAIGIGGGVIMEEVCDTFKRRGREQDDYVSGAVQFFRRACFEQIGGYVPARYGGEDTVAALKANLAGWKVRSFADLPVFHLEQGERKRGPLREMFRDGAMYQSLGSDPAYELMKCLRKAVRPPYLIGGAVRWAGYLWPLMARPGRTVDEHAASRRSRRRLRPCPRTRTRRQRGRLALRPPPQIHRRPRRRARRTRRHAGLVAGLHSGPL